MKKLFWTMGLIAALLWSQAAYSGPYSGFLDQFGSSVAGAASQLVGAAQRVMGQGDAQLQNKLTGTINILQEAVKGTVETTSAEAINAALDAVNAATSLAEKYGTEAAQATINQAMGLLTQAIAQAEGLSDNAKALLQTCANQLGNAASHLNVPFLFESAQGMIVNALENFSMSTVMDAIGDAATKAGDEAVTVINGLIEQIENTVDEGIRNELLDKLESYLKTVHLGEDVREQAEKALEKLRNGEFAEGIVAGVDMALALAKDDAEGVLGELLGEETAGELMDILNDLAHGNYTLDEAMGEGLEKILDSLPDSSADALKEFVSSILEEEGSMDLMESLHDLVEVASKDAMAGLLNLVGIDEGVRMEVLEAISSMLDGDFSNAWNISKDALLDTVSNAVEKVLGENSAEIARNAAESLLNAGANLLSDAGEYLGNLATMATDALTKALNDQLNKLTQKYPALGKVLDALGIDKGNVIGSISNIWNSLQDMPQKLQEMMTKLVDSISGYLDGLLDKLQDFALDMLENLLNQAVDWVKNGISGLLDALQGAVKASLGDLVSKLNDLKESAESFSGYFLKSESRESTLEMKDAMGQPSGQRVLQFDGK